MCILYAIYFNVFLVASRTLWFGRLPQNCTEQNIKDAVKDSGSSPEKINIIGSRACAYVTMAQRRAAYKLIDRLHRDIRVNGKSIKLEWATGAGINKSDQIMDFWDSSRGYFEIPHKKLPKDFAKFLDGNHLVVESLPSELKGKTNLYRLICFLGKYTESGPVQDSDHHGDKNESVQMMDIPLPNLDQLPPPIAGFQPTMGNDNGGVLPGLPSLAFPGFIQPNLLAAVLAQQQTQPGFDNLVWKLTIFIKCFFLVHCSSAKFGRWHFTYSFWTT
jgi:RNA recognition motif-containing protein